MYRQDTDVRHGKSFYQMQRAMSVAIGIDKKQMAYAVIFAQSKGEQVLKSAMNVADAVPDDEGIDFFHNVMHELDELVERRLENAMRQP